MGLSIGWIEGEGRTETADVDTGKSGSQNEHSSAVLELVGERTELREH